jgi:AcrR family transcriptional regulator
LNKQPPEKEEKEDLRTKRTKHLLREAIAKLLEKKDIKKISIQQISMKAMIYRTTFYAHYSDKYELLEDFLMDKWKDEFENVSDLNSENKKEKYREGLLNTVKFFKRYSTHFIQLNENRSIISKNNLIYKTIKEFFTIWLDLIQPNNSETQVSKEIAADFYIAGYLNLILEWLMGGVKESCEEMTDIFIILSDKNLEYILHQT